MRIWDIHPGYLNRQSLLGEHRELHGLVSIMVNNKKGYSQHPETLRWINYGWAIKQRHQELVCEMNLRGYKDNSPVRTRKNKNLWPINYIDKPHIQFALLKEKYKDKEGGRIPLPSNTQEVWAQHKYSVMARSTLRYKEIGRKIANKNIDMQELSIELVELLRTAPNIGGVRNALQHMWGYVSDVSENKNIKSWSLKTLLKRIQENTKATKQPYLTHSTALSELMLWVK